MSFLHPIFLLIFGLLFYLFLKNDDLESKNSNTALLFVCLLMIIGAGGRYYSGADYPVYKNMYEESLPMYTTYIDVWNKAIFKPNSMEIEWLFVLINKILFDFGASFHVLTFILATISITLLYKTFTKYSAFPALSFMFYFMAIYFYSDCGQMRQALGTAICIYSIKFIIKRDVIKFLFCMFFALGMHKTAIIFVPAYWLVLLPFNANRWMIMLVISIILAPLQIYTYFGGLLSSFTPQDVSSAFEGYSNDKYYGNALETGFGDVINLAFIFLLYRYDKQGQKNIYYYEYYRNLAFFGYCLYYVFRGNEIFATRLPGPYLAFSGYFAATAILASSVGSVKRFLTASYVSFFLFIYVLFANGNGKRGSFTFETYRNVLWSKI